MQRDLQAGDSDTGIKLNLAPPHRGQSSLPSRTLNPKKPHVGMEPICGAGLREL